jgi:small membrane protein
MKPIQILLVGVTLFLAAYYLRRVRSRLAQRLLLLLLAVGELAMIIEPGVSSWLAAMVGVGRGVDLVFYLAFAGVGFVALHLYARQRALEARLVELVREMALLHAQRPAEAEESGMTRPATGRNISESSSERRAA